MEHRQQKVDEARDVKGHGGNRKDQDYKNGKHNLDPPRQGTSDSYRLGWLKRRASDTKNLTPSQRALAQQALDGYVRGEFRSVAAAVRHSKGEAAHPPRKVPTPLDLLRRWWKKASKQEREAFRRFQEATP